jgi:hypothetical protein
VTDEELRGDVHDLRRMNSEDSFGFALHRASARQRDRREGFASRLWAMDEHEVPAVEQIEEQVEDAYDEADASHPWVVTAIDGDQVVSDRVSRQEAAEGLALGADA